MDSLKDRTWQRCKYLFLTWCITPSKKNKYSGFPLLQCWAEWEEKVRHLKKGSWNDGSLYAGDWSVPDFCRVMGEIVSAAQLINRTGGSIYLCLRQSCWEMGAPEMRINSLRLLPLAPVRSFHPVYPPLECGVWRETDKKASPEPPASALCAHNSCRPFNIFCPIVRSRQKSFTKKCYFLQPLSHNKTSSSNPPCISTYTYFAYFISQIREFYTRVTAGLAPNERWDMSYFSSPIQDNCSFGFVFNSHTLLPHLRRIE